ncbi:tetratricopeptide repeat protein [Kamptonema formosum]|uniref:tetratricopeptide repeat protein n=1 Tax=Kamptonema formosum TaxID=331992 RepID=UPI00034DB601|nr:tetratricopeptide repeat protein [Oscillatoria sp. PCC 10802]
MKHTGLILVLTLPLIGVSGGGAHQGASAVTQLVTQAGGAMDAGGNFLLAKSVCPPKQPCIQDGRGGSTGINIISPCGGSILKVSELKLSWSAVPGAKSYSVRVERSKQPLWEKIVENRTEIPFPAGELTLEPDKDYELIVESDNRKSGSVRFRMLAEDKAQQVRAEASEIAANTKLSADDKAIKLAEVYRENELFTEAIETLAGAVKNGSRSVPVHLMLGELYLKVKLPGLAEAPYQQALTLATSDTEAQAKAQVGLGRASVALQNWERAISSLQAAYAIYERLKKPDAPQVAQLLGEVYERSGNRDEAIVWYQKAKAGYEALGDKLRQENVEEMLRNLSR